MSTENKDGGVPEAFKLPEWSELSPEKKINFARFFLSINKRKTMSEAERQKRLETLAFLRAIKEGPYAIPSPEVGKYLAEFKEGDPCNDEIPDWVIAFLDEEELLDDVKKAYFLRQMGGGRFLREAIENYGLAIIPAIERLRAYGGYEEKTLVFMAAYTQAKVTAKNSPGESSDEDDSEEKIDEEVIQAMAKLREEGKDKKVLDVMEANYRNSFKQT